MHAMNALLEYGAGGYHSAGVVTPEKYKKMKTSMMSSKDVPRDVAKQSSPLL